MSEKTTTTVTDKIRSDVCISLPKFTANKIDKIIALTLNVRNVICPSIETSIIKNKVSLKFSTEQQKSQKRFYGLLMLFPDNTNVLSITNDIWDNNIIFQVEIDNTEILNFKYSSSDESYYKEYNLVDQIQQIEKENEKDDLLNIQIEANEEKTDKSISIEIKTNANDEDCDDNKAEDFDSKKIKKANRRKLKNRSMSESFCDNLKVISEKTETPVLLDDDIKNCNRKFRSISECYNSESENTIEGITKKLKSILKSSFTRSISECSDFQDPYSCSMDDGSFTLSLIDHNCLSESCKKSVRFNDNIKKQIFRSNTSILSQKKKNLRKKENKKKMIQRRNSESTDNEEKNNHENPHHDSGIDLNEEGVQNDNQKLKNIVDGKHDMIFEIDM